MRTLLVAACLGQAAALYADQAGEQDWHRENIGRVTHAASKQKALFVLTEAGDRSLVASLGARTGNLNWRTALPPNEKGHAVALTDKAVITLSGEGKCRAWNQAGGALLWEQPALPGKSSQALAVIEAGKTCTVAVLAGNAVAFWDCSTGAARGAWFAERDEDAQLAAALPRGASLELRTLLAHKGRVLVAGAANGKALLASLDVPSGQSVQASSAVLVGRSLSGMTLAARAQGPPLLVTLDESGSITAYDALLAKAPLATLDGATLLGEKPLALEAEANQRVLRLQGASRSLLVAGVEDMTGGKRQVLVPLGDSCTNCALGASEQHGRVAWARVDHDYGYAVRELDGALISEDQAPLSSDVHGPPTSCAPQLFELKKGGAGARVFVVSRAHTLASLQGDNVAWSRDEALANAQNPVFVDAAPKKISRKSKIPTFSQRLALQLEACLTFADGLIDSVKDVFQPTASSKALKKKRNAIRYGFDKIAVVMNSEAGRVFGLEMDTGDVRWSALVEPGSQLTKSSEDEVLIVSKTSLTYINALDGSTTGTDHIAPLDALVPAVSIKGRVAFLGVNLRDDGASVRVLPESAESQVAKALQETPTHFHVIRDGIVRCFRVSSTTEAVEVGAVVVAPLETDDIVSVAHPDGAPVSTAAHVLGDDALLLKYLNPHLLIVLTTSKGGESAPLLDVSLRAEGEDQVAPPSLTVTLIDVVAASVAHRVVVPHGSAPASATLSENFVAYTYWNAKAKRSEVGAISLHEGLIERFGLSPFKVPEQSSTRSSLTAPPPVALQRTFALAKPVLTISSTRTQRGVASKHVLLGMEPGQIAGLDRRALDPRRPVLEDDATKTQRKKAERELQEGLSPYRPFVPLVPRQMVSHTLTIVGLKNIYATDSKLESTSLVLACGVDLFGARHTPSGAFDLIADDFNYALLVLLLGAMSMGMIMLRRAAAAKNLSLMWI
jgi:hypothetical protein